MESGKLSSNWKLLQKKLKGDSKINGTGKVIKKQKVAAKRQPQKVVEEEVTPSEDNKLQVNERVVSTVTVGSKTVTHRVFTLPASLASRKPAHLLRYEDTELHSKSALDKPPRESAKKADAGSYVAIDCEFVGVGHLGSRSALARVSIVNYYGTVLLDKFVKPKERVTDWRTWVSGVSPKDMKDAITFEEAQKLAADVFKNRIVVGHAVYNDLKALMLSHPKSSIRDTSNHRPFRKLCKGAPGLKRLAEELLEMEIQTGEHSSVEDAQATMLLFRLNKSEFDKTVTTGKRKRRD
ncbi:RNA exonuclease 4 [Trichomonascus vanleenenianus]|uniref:putative 3'-5' exonuclease n=1 Tax=Trichomonascus vanleenenianus TaxID=2268995 RepID=UPI003ECA1C39